MNAADIMTRRVVTVAPDALVADAARLMIANRISGVPVVRADRTVVGMVTEGDFLRRAEIGTEKHRSRWLEFLIGPGRLAADYVHAHARKVDEVMTSDVVSVAEDAPLADIVRLMEKRRIKRVPVLRDGTLVGIVSRANLLQALSLVSAPALAGTAGDAELRDRIIAEIDRQPWGPGASINVIVKDGVADLCGCIFDERERLALKVAAETVPGVKAVRDNLVWVEPTSGFVVDPPPATTAA